MLLRLLIAFLASYAAAQTSTTPAESSSSMSSAASESSASWPVVSIFLPIDVQEHLGASVVSAGPLKTVFEVHCLTTSACKYNKGFLLTGGESTFECTNTYLDPEGSADSPLTISCDLSGGVPAREAICTGSSVISGLGTVGSTSTLSHDQITYAPLTITAGAQKLLSVPTAVSSSSSSSGSAPAVTAALFRVVGGAAAAAALLGVGGGL